jgi:DNA-directed RNA polymerase subunit M/transcription elongation factor TFIIS
LRRKTKRFIEQSNNKYLQIARNFIEVCPQCGSIHISVRQRKIPKYYCKDCKNEFDDPKAKIEQKTIKQKNETGKQYHNPEG